jgi:hypothetical protein
LNLIYYQIILNILFINLGMIGDLWGSVSCRHHDSYLLQHSRLHQRLTLQLAQFYPVTYLTFGDAAYPLLRYHVFSMDR